MPTRIVHSFIHAFRGIALVFREEFSFRIQLGIGVLVLALAWYLEVRPWEFIVLLLVAVFVLVLELGNSVVERMVDMFRPRLHHAVGDIKDLMAATVLFASIGAMVIGIVILVPYIYVRVVAGL